MVFGGYPSTYVVAYAVQGLRKCPKGHPCTASTRLVGEPSPLIVPRIPHSTAYSLSVGSALHQWGVPLGRGGFRYYPTPTNSQPRGVSAPFYCCGVFTIAHATADRPSARSSPAPKLCHHFPMLMPFLPFSFQPHPNFSTPVFFFLF